jgi:hypothetical protein
MKTKEIITNEMAHSTADTYAITKKDTWLAQSKYIADMDNHKIRKYNNTYSVWDDTELIACASIIDSNIPEIDNIWVHQNYRGQKLFSKLLWFFFTRLNINKLVIGDTHSNNMQEVLKTIRIPKYWINSKTGQTDPYTPDNVEKYYEFPWGEWKLLIDNTDGFKNWPMFNGNGFTKESYEGNVF